MAIAIMVWRVPVFAGVNFQGVNFQGVNFQGVNFQGVNFQGVNFQGTAPQGVNFQGVNFQGVNFQGVNFQGVNFQGVNFQGTAPQGVNFQGVNFQGVNFQGVNFQGVNFQGVNFQGASIDRGRVFASSRQIQGVSRADFSVSAVDLRGLQGNSSIHDVQVVAPMAGVKLQHGATTSSDDAAAGSFIYVPTSATDASAVDLTGSFWNMVLADGCTDDTQCPASTTCSGGACVKACSDDSQCAVAGAKCVQGSCSDVESSIALYISDVDVDHQQNSSKYPSNDDIYLYSVYYRQPATGQWASLCPIDGATGKPTAMAVPLNPFDHSDAERSKFTFACTASGVASKCARNWGYKPWKTVTENLWNGSAFVSTDIPLASFYDACLIAARADYCQDDHSYTKNGTLVDLFDSLDGFTSINSTVGLPYAPYSSGTMFHEEYQVSALNIGSKPPAPHLVGENFTDDQLMSMPDKGVLVSSLRMSGMESSRYADLDPGRSCAAGPYINRCDPKEPFECYRSDLKTEALGAFLAVNSPRHCSHDEDHEGEALDPLCNECVNRVCQVDPTCCADPGGSFYPGSLVWDQRCTDIRSQVCRSDADPSSPLWPAGTTAPLAGSHPVVFLRGAIGSFEGIVSEGGTSYVEGWACDPDHPGASVNVQISVGGTLGATDSSANRVSTLYTSAADRPLVSGWNDAVAAECGDDGTAPHGFRFPLPAAAAGADVYVYGIDLDTPGAPYSLLRGGKKTAPPAAAPRAAIWSGWVTPPASGHYQFLATAGGTDKYRLWVNGIFVAGNWKDPDPSASGAFELDPPTAPPAFYMLAGVRYDVRVEYLRSDTLPSDSQFRLSWSSPDSPPAVSPGPVPATALYPIAQGSGNGLAGNYYLGTSLPASGAGDGYTLGAVDYLWTTGKPPIPATTGSAGVSVAQDFTARFEGQVVPPISGDYTFTADTDGTVQIFVNDQLVTGASGVPSFVANNLCPHTICSTGAALSKTCGQGFFCSAQICLSDPGCCAQTWDAICVKKVADICGLDCNPAPPIAITLQAGVKYQIRVEYHHLGSTGTGPTETVHGARLQLKWALPGTVSDVIPQARLFAGVTNAPAGVGLNAAYFVPDTSGNAFGTEYLDHVEGGIAFDASSPTPPAPTLANGIVCGSDAGEPTCTSVAVPGAPALIPPSTPPTAGTITLAGAGAVRSGSVSIYECTVDAATGECALDAAGAETWNLLVPAAAVASNACDDVASPTEVCGNFSVSVNLSRGTHWLAAAQSAPVHGEGRIRLIVTDAPDTSAPAAPGVSQPPAGFSSANGNVPVGGSAVTGDTVTVTATSGRHIETFTFSASAWVAGATINLPPGDWSLTITQSDGVHSSAAGTPLDVKVALPPLTLDSPNDGASITAATTLSGSGAVPSIDNTPVDVIIGDGDGRYFDERLEHPDTSHAAVQPGGTFSKILVPPGVSVAGALSLDYGKHVLKAFQRVNGLAGAGALLTVQVPPPRPALTTITTSSYQAGSPAVDVGAQDNVVVVRNVVINGTGLLRNGASNQSSLPVRANVYQGQTKLGQAVLDAKTGAFAVPITIAGVGKQTLSITQVASSLSGAGDAESDPVKITVIVSPPAPIIRTPATGSQLADAPFTVGGIAATTADPDNTVTIVPDVGTGRTVSVGADGTFTTHPGTDPTDAARDLSVGAGIHTVTAYQTVDGARGPASPAIVVAVGDVTPPQLSLSATISVTCKGPDVLDSTPGLSPGPACDDSGATVGFAPLITATDDVTSLPAQFDQCIAAGECACSQTSGSEMPFGTTAVSCTARDNQGNVGSTTFAVSITSKALPDIDATGLNAEAQGPAGAPVNYQITATGFVASCGDPTEVVPCASWTPAYNGLGFIPVTVAMDASDGANGTLYAHFYGDALLGPNAGVNTSPAETMLKSTDGGANWQQLPAPGAVVSRQLVAAAGSVYVASAAADGGVRISHDGGLTWVTGGPAGRPLYRIALDPRDARHMIATGNLSPGDVFETHDGWATWQLISDGLPGGSGFNPPGTAVGAGMIAALAFDPLTAGRVYASVQPEPSDAIKTKLYRRVGSGSWQRLSVPTYPDAVANAAASVAVAPVLRPNQQFPRVFAGTVMSDDGGETWLDLPYFSTVENLVFSPADSHVLYAATFGNMWRSSDGGDTWNPTTQFSAPIGGTLIADLHDTQTIYASSGQDNIVGIGLYRSTNGGATWAPVEAPGVALPGARIKDLAVDPVDPKVAYLISDRGGVFKTTTSGDSWEASNVGIDDPFSLQDASKIAVDPLARNNVYVGRIGLWQSVNSGALWTNPGAAAFNELSDFAVDPLKPGTVFLAGSTQSGLVQDGLNNPTAFDFELANGTLRAIDSAVTFNSTFIESYHVQVAADPTRTVFKSWQDHTAGLEFDGASTFSLTAAEKVLGVTVPATNDRYGNVEAPFRPYFVYDRSDGTDRLFAGGNQIPGASSPSSLYRGLVQAARVSGVQSAQWEELTPGGPAGFSDFTRLLIDPGSAGQVMYTLGTGNTLWRSDDGGKNWREDASVPAGMFVTNIWLSPADGALFATLAPAAADTSALYHTIGATAYGNGLLWKRSAQAMRPGARAVKASLRPICTVVVPDTVLADDPKRLRAVSPGATFPVDDDTTVECKVTDAFGNSNSKQFTITVRDTTPPTLTVPAQVLNTVASNRSTVTVAFTGANAVTASDLVDPSPTAACTAPLGIGGATAPVTLAGTAFPVGAWTVTCTATDAHGNAASASFPVIISKQGQTALAPPTWTIPTSKTANATGTTGAFVSLDVIVTSGVAAHPALTPTCTAPIGTGGATATLARTGNTFTGLFPIGTSEVTCTATDTAQTPALTFARSIPVTVNDAGPRIHVPDDINKPALDDTGLAVSFTVTADDDVDGTLDPVCAPPSDSKFPIGVTTVTCHVSDHAGNVATESFHVTITGHPPVLHLPTQPVIAYAQDQYGGPFNYDNLVSATDADDFSCTPSGIFPLGDTTVSCRASNVHGDTEGSFIVRLIDNEAPDVTVPPGMTLEAAGPAGSPVTFTRSLPPSAPTITVAAVDGQGHTLVDAAGNPLSFVVSTHDLVSGSPLPTCRRANDPADLSAINPGPPQFPLGDDVVTCSATDEAGNPGTGSFTIVVRDTTAPELHLPTVAPVVPDASGGATVIYDDGTNLYATDAVSGDPVNHKVAISCTPRSGSRFLIGSTTVACLARDAAGNERAGAFQVVVSDPSRGRPCTSGAQCGNGLCVDGVCCDSACGGGDLNDCQACSVAAGGTTDGTCTPLPAAHVCRLSAGVCDLAESCDGHSPACPADAFAVEGTTCRPSTGICDVAETCTGNSAACPADVFSAAGTVCRASAGACDLAETCTGSSGACPADSFVPGGTVCRASAGTCDVAEACSGSSATCPADTFVPAGVTCRASTGVCDPPETCSGASAACPPDKLSPPDVICRPSAGACDVAELCSGASGACPPDGFLPPTTICRAKNGDCDVAETCSGSSATCPADGFVAGGTVCRAAAGACDVAEKCSGASGACPADAPASAGTVCAAGDTCHSPATCSGTAVTCPPPAPIPGCGNAGPPVFSNVPGPIVAYATCAQGAVVTYTKPTATDPVDGVIPVTCTPASGSMFAPGPKTVTCSATDSRKLTATVSFTVTVKFQAPTDGTFFLQPINPDGSSIFKLGSTIPVKFKLTGVSAGITNLVAKMAVAKVSNNVAGTFMEATSTSAADSGSTFRYDATNKQYIFNLSTKTLSTGTWSLRADLGDQVSHIVNVSLK